LADGITQESVVGAEKAIFGSARLMFIPGKMSFQARKISSQRVRENVFP